MEDSPSRNLVYMVAIRELPHERKTDEEMEVKTCMAQDERLR